MGAVLNWGPEEGIKFPDPADAGDYSVETTLIAFMSATSALAAKMVELSAEKARVDDLLREFRKATTLAYVHALNGDVRKVEEILDGVCDK